jgi:hypothetical protein
MVQVMPLLPLLTGDSQRAPFWGWCSIPRLLHAIQPSDVQVFFFQVLQMLEQMAELGVRARTPTWWL